MSIYIDRQYLTQISHKLERFTQKNPDLYNFRCPYCLDSKKNRLKARGYIYRKGNDLFYRCHNCGTGTTFSNFLKQIDVDTHKKYVLECYSNGNHKNSPVEKPNFDELKGNAFSRLVKTVYVPSIKKISELEENHFARTYIQNRAIPKIHWEDIYFTENFKDFLDRDFPNHDKEFVPNDERIVLFFRNETGEIVSISARALNNTKIRYIKVNVKDEKKIFGLHRLQYDKKVYVVEGEFDSLFITNCVASGNSDLCGVARNLESNTVDIVLVFDNEPRNKEIVKQIENAIGNNYNVCLFPEEVNGKDINEMILNGFTSDQIVDIINANTYNGLTARMNFVRWKKC